MNTRRPANSYNDDIGKRLGEARAHAALTQKQLAEKSGVSQQMISKLEQGQSKGTTDLVPIAIACGVSPEWLFSGTLPMFGPVLSRAMAREIEEISAAYLAASMEQRHGLLILVRSFGPGAAAVRMARESGAPA